MFAWKDDVAYDNPAGPQPDQLLEVNEERGYVVRWWAESADWALYAYDYLGNFCWISDHPDREQAKAAAEQRLSQQPPKPEGPCYMCAAPADQWLASRDGRLIAACAEHA